MGRISTSTDRVLQDSLQVYWGSFLVDCKPLEISLNDCRRCHYCFAHLNRPNRAADAGQIVRLLADYENRSTFPAKLLQQRYPVCVSNHTDPLDNGSLSISMPVVELLRELNLPIALQTKGPTNSKVRDWLFETLEGYPVHVYVTITTLDPAIAREQEPGAPSPQDRLQLVRDLRAAGHRVTCGINPAVPEWVGDEAGLVDAIASAGAEGLWTEPLHFHADQLRNMSERGREAIGEDIINRAKRRKRHPIDTRCWETIRSHARAIGLPVMSVGNGEPSAYFDSARAIFPRSFPVLQDFVNWCFERKQAGDLLTIDDFLGVILPQLPEGVHSIGHHMGAMAYDLWEGSGGIQNRMDYRTLLGYFWRHERLKTSPINAPCFSIPVVKRRDGTFAKLLDDNGEALLTFVPEGTSELYTEVRL